MPMKNSKLKLAVGLAVAFGGLALGQIKMQQYADAATGKGVQAPTFEVDPFWPKPLPNHWLLGNVIGVAVDAKDHIYIVHRNDKFAGTELGLASGVSECCAPAPPVVEFDADGNFVKAWGGPGEGYTWPSSNHGMEIDSNGNVWIGGNGGTPGGGPNGAKPE